MQEYRIGSLSQREYRQRRAEVLDLLRDASRRANDSDDEDEVRDALLWERLFRSRLELLDAENAVRLLVGES